MRIILIGNYPLDQQRSMLRFAELLAEGLKSAGHQVECLSPKVIFAGLVGDPRKGIGKWLGYLDKYLFAPVLLRRMLSRINESAVIHICDHSNAHYLISAAGKPCVVTCHDLIAVRSANGKHPGHRPRWSGRLQQKIVVHYLKRASAIVSISGQTRRHVEELCEDKQPRHYEVANALDPIFTQAAVAKVGPSNESYNSPYLLLVGSAAWYKNRKSALKLFDRISESMPTLRLKVVGPAFSETEMAGFKHLQEQIDYCQKLDDHELIVTYRNARLLLFPSFIEGFGWPIVEAQACGCPVFTLKREPMSLINAYPLLISEKEPLDNDWLETSAMQCLRVIQISKAEREALSLELMNYALRFDLNRMIEGYCNTYQAELEAQK